MRRIVRRHVRATFPVIDGDRQRTSGYFGERFPWWGVALSFCPVGFVPGEHATKLFGSRLEARRPSSPWHGTTS